MNVGGEKSEKRAVGRLPLKRGVRFEDSVPNRTYIVTGGAPAQAGLPRQREDGLEQADNNPVRMDGSG